MQTLALDIGGSKLLAAVVEIDGTELRPIENGRIAHCALSPSCTRDELFDRLDESVRKLGPISFENIGVTIPGLADPAAGVWVYACFSGIRDLPVAAILSERYGGKPVHLDNDVNACALAEKMFGKCRNLDDFLWITVSNGIGGGLVLDGRPYRGHFGGAAEVGHFNVADGRDGDVPFRCGCGNLGCLEAEAAGPGIARRYADRLMRSGREEPPGRDPSAKEIADLARAGDPLARSVLETTGERLGGAASYAVNLMNLEAVVFGGGVMESFDLLYPSMKKSFDEKIFRSANPSVRLEKTGLGYHAGLAGAAALALLAQNDRNRAR